MGRYPGFFSGILHLIRLALSEYASGYTLHKRRLKLRRGPEITVRVRFSPNTASI